MTHLADKLKLLAEGTSGFAANLEKKVDDALAAHSAKQKDISNRVDTVFGKVDAINADAESGLKVIEDTLGQLTNS